jgi:hypothetical protein
MGPARLTPLIVSSVRVQGIIRGTVFPKNANDFMYEVPYILLAIFVMALIASLLCVRVFF